MRRKTWYMVGFLIILTLAMEISCWETSDDKTEVDGDTTLIFYMEYDHMWSYDVLENDGEQRLRDAFSPSGTELIIHVSNWIDDEVWDYRDLDSVYVPMYADRTNGLFDHKCYLLAMGEVTNLPVPDIGGATRDDGQPGKVRSFIFVHNIREYYPDYEKMVHKVTIHEMGHARANLSHLCQADGTMSPDHDVPDCIMAQGRWASCTGFDVTLELRFCNMCRERISNVSW
jgi:hypothetical protein